MYYNNEKKSQDLNPVVPDPKAPALHVSLGEESWWAQGSHQGLTLSLRVRGLVQSVAAARVGTMALQWQTQESGICSCSCQKELNQVNESAGKATTKMPAPAAAGGRAQLLLVEVWGKLKLVMVQGSVEIPKQWACITMKHGN